MKVIVDIEDNVEYMSFYLKGLEEIFGHGSMYYSRRAFDDLPQEARFCHSVRFILKDGLRERRYAIDTTDPCTVNAALYDWCDVYGSVNANRKRTPESLQAKLVALCPSFAIRHTDAIRAVAGVLHSMATTRGNRRKQLGRWKRVMQRPRIEDYALCQPREGYVFHLSTLWQSDEWNRNDEGVNLRRAEFIRACRELGTAVTFEGGLVSTRNDKASQQFSDCLCRRYPANQCLDLTRQSALVFNTPAYWDCHGWKLGEYMALGKATLTTPLINDLPAPLEHGKHVHVVEHPTREALKEAILQMMDNQAYRKQLGRNLHHYWQQYGTPQASLKLMGITR